MNISDQLGKIVDKWSAKFEAQAPVRTQAQEDLLKRQIAAAQSVKSEKPLTGFNWLFHEADPGWNSDGAGSTAADTLISLPGRRGVDAATMLAAPVSAAAGRVAGGEPEEMVPEFINELDQNLFGMLSYYPRLVKEKIFGDKISQHQARDSVVKRLENPVLRDYSDTRFDWELGMPVIGHAISAPFRVLGETAGVVFSDGSYSDFFDIDWFPTPRPGVTDETAAAIAERNRIAQDAIDSKLPFGYRDFNF